MTNWLTLDIGNTAIKLGLFEGSHLKRHDRVEHGPDLQSVVDLLIESAPVVRCAIVSVVPVVSEVARRVLGARGLVPLEISPRLTLPFRMGYRTPETLGADRIAAAAGAWAIRSGTGPVVAIDAGTALTYEVIDGEGVYRGGAIAPGPAIMMSALHRGTAQLPEVALDEEPAPIGDTTHSAIQAGIVLGFSDSVTGMLRRIADELGEVPYVVVTGGWAERLASTVASIDHVDPHLVLRGVRELMALNSGPNSP